MENETKKNLIPLAQAFAHKSFEGIVTTTVGGLVRPRIMHMQEVADLVWAAGGTDVEIAAAWLHDIVEDTPTTLQEIHEAFGTSVGDIVAGLTDPEDFKPLALSERKARQAERLANENTSVRLVKLADQISNVRQMALDPTNEMTPVECSNYIKGAKLLADACSGTNILLDELFLDAYAKGMKRFKD